MSDDKKTPVDEALDLLVFAPLGLLSLAREQLPSLVKRGRQQIEGQMTMAKMMGQFAVQQGRHEAEKAVNDLVERFNPPPPPAPAKPAAAPADPQPAAAAPAARPPAPPATNGVSPAARPDAGDLAIPGYDTLSASQVVPRLAGLGAEELEAVRAYETATRGRRTILNKVAQLQAHPAR